MKPNIGNADNFSLYLSALDSSNSGIIITDNTIPDNPIIYCNKTFTKMTGYSYDQIVGHNCRFLQGNDRDQNARFDLKMAVEESQEIKLEIRNYKKNGELFWNELNVSPIRNKEGEITHFIGVQNDVTEQKRILSELQREKLLTEEKVRIRTKELEQNQNFLTGIIETIRESLIVLDSQYNIISVNNYFVNTFKINTDDFIGKSIFAVDDGQWNISDLKELLLNILPTNNPVLNYRVENQFPRIGKKVMLLNAHRIEFDHEFTDKILVAIEDITERVQIEERKDDFLSVASHELKTPLTIIKGLSQILMRSKNKPITENFFLNLEKLNSSVDNLNKLADELLNTSLIKSGLISSNLEKVSVDDIIMNSIQYFESINPQIKINFNILEKGDVWVDRTQIEQVTNNLIANAIKYSPGSYCIDVTVQSVGNYIKVSVRDYGIGVDNDDREKIFKRFFRSDNVQKKFGGMGIGLYISKKIITNHGGTIWIDDQSEKGSIFNFTLPKYSIDA